MRNKTYFELQEEVNKKKCCQNKLEDEIEIIYREMEVKPFFRLWELKEIYSKNNR